jgi:hypothetical protein
MIQRVFLFTLILSYTAFAYIANPPFRKSEFLKNTCESSIAYTDTNLTLTKKLTDFSFGEFDSTTYFEQLEKLRPLKYKKLIPEKFPRKWIPLYQLKDVYYLYRPCDWGNHFRFEITDSTTIDYTMEGPEPSRLNKITFPSNTHTIIERSNYWEGRRVEIKIIDTVKGIAVLTFNPTKYKKFPERKLLIDATKANLFPVIANDCPTSKSFEINFDKTDFDALLKKSY